MQDKLGGLFGGRRPSKPGGGGQGASPLLWGIIAIGLAALLFYATFWRIEPAERGVVLRFGKYVETLQPGPHFQLPRPIDEVIVINVDQIRPFTVNATMLTGDENIVDVEMGVQYRINDIKNYLFKIADPDSTVQRVTESAIRDIIGQSTLDFVITEGRAEIGTGARALIQQILDNYESGIEITSVNMQPAKPPEEVKAAFDDAIKAREDEQRRINEAEAYRREIDERAQGEAARIRLQAEAYREQVVAEASGEAKRFEQLLVEYEKAPAVTRQRLYLDAIEEVLADNPKVMLENKGGNSLMYLPIDKLMDRAAGRDTQSTLRDLLPDEQAFPRSP
ncbi:MAG TPA: FtsH protease activity modulator HflK, partial [Gammaproteobacteria bacterium]|nr:FtsH protease activity modulator HflK [Gammaproteobacteria bacterium]